jgi:ABC-type glycerol-3-phosphate transport system permease component
VRMASGGWPRAGVLYAGGLVLFLVGAFPLLWMLSTSLKPSSEIFATPPTLVPVQSTLENFTRLFAETSFLSYFRNSVVVSLATVLLTLSISAAGAYGLTRCVFPGREKVAGLILMTYMFAPIMIIIPFYILVKRLGLVNTHLALVLSYTTFCLPFCLWLLRSFFQSIPLELEEAALVDGAGLGRAVWYVVLPLALPGIIAAGIFTFILAWNDFLFALVLITSEELKTLPVGVNDLFNATIVDWGMIMAAGVVITVPTIAFFVAVQRYLIQGWGAGGVKG